MELCPICGTEIAREVIEYHVNECLDNQIWYGNRDFQADGLLGQANSRRSDNLASLMAEVAANREEEVVIPRLLRERAVVAPRDENDLDHLNFRLEESSPSFGLVYADNGRNRADSYMDELRGGPSLRIQRHNVFQGRYGSQLYVLEMLCADNLLLTSLVVVLTLLSRELDLGESFM